MQPGDGHQPTPGRHRIVAPSTAVSRREPSATQSAILQPFQLYGGAYSFGGLVESQPNTSTFPAWWGGSYFQGLIPSDDTVISESAEGIKPVVVIRNQVDEFTHT